MTMTNQQNTRRQFLQAAAAIGVGSWIKPATSFAYRSANEQLNIAAIGIGGQGQHQLGGCKSENLVAVCDVDDERCASSYKKYSQVPKAKRFYDFRKMFDTMSDQIDAVTISTPDHTHFHPSLWAMERGKHVYLEKPLAHSVWEIRTLTNMAKKQKLATQLGSQRHAKSNMRRVVELIQSGVIGRVTEAHSWVSSSRGMPGMPSKFPDVPNHMKWDLWLGPAPEHKYTPDLAPYNWRFFWDYGTGETGNWGCHILDIPYWALDLKFPTHVSASGPSAHEFMTPKTMTSRFEFPTSVSGKPVVLHWSQAKGGPEAVKKLGVPTSVADSSGKKRGCNTLFVGEKGMLVCGFDSYKLLPEENFEDVKLPASYLPKSPGFHKEWINACKGGEPASCNFDYTGPLSETVILANVAYRAGETFTWDAETMTAKGADKAQALIKPEFRKGWSVAAS